jgi:hypothetical protein
VSLGPISWYTYIYLFRICAWEKLPSIDISDTAPGAQLPAVRSSVGTYSIWLIKHGKKQKRVSRALFFCLKRARGSRKPPRSCKLPTFSPCRIRVPYIFHTNYNYRQIIGLDSVSNGYSSITKRDGGMEGGGDCREMQWATRISQAKLFLPQADNVFHTWFGDSRGLIFLMCTRVGRSVVSRFPAGGRGLLMLTRNTDKCNYCG